jgi:membrane glycosyltransferase
MEHWKPRPREPDPTPWRDAMDRIGVAMIFAIVVLYIVLQGWWFFSARG